MNKKKNEIEKSFELFYTQSHLAEIVLEILLTMIESEDESYPEIACELFSRDLIELMKSKKNRAIELVYDFAEIIFRAGVRENLFKHLRGFVASALEKEGVLIDEEFIRLEKDLLEVCIQKLMKENAVERTDELAISELGGLDIISVKFTELFQLSKVLSYNLGEPVFPINIISKDYSILSSIEFYDYITGISFHSDALLDFINNLNEKTPRDGDLDTLTFWDFRRLILLQDTFYRDEVEILENIGHLLEEKDAFPLNEKLRLNAEKAWHAFTILRKIDDKEEKYFMELADQVKMTISEGEQVM